MRDVHQLAVALSFNSGLLRLNLTHNSINMLGALALAAALQVNGAMNHDELTIRDVNG